MRDSFASAASLKMLTYFENSPACKKLKNLDWSKQRSFYELPNLIC